MKNWQNQDHENFKRSIKTIARAMLPDFPKTDGQGTDEQVLDLLIKFRDVTNGMEKDWSMDEATKNFQLWLLDNFVRPGMNEQEFLSVSIERSVGNERVTFSLGAHFAIGSGAGRSVSYDRLTDAINIEFDRYVRDRLPAQKENTDIGQNGNTSDIVTVDCERLNVEIKSGKRYYKVICGQWTQHGVNYWPETIRAAGVDPNKIPLEGYSLVGYKATVEMVGGKAKRVLKIQKNG